MPEIYHRLDRAFRDALQQQPTSVVTADYNFAGKTARARLIGSTLAQRFGRPFTHLGSSPVGTAATPDLRIDLWDETATGVPSDGAARPDAHAHAVVKASADGRWISRRKANTWIAFDRHAAHVVGSVADGERMSQIELGRPLHSQLLLWLKDLDIPTVHAGLVALRGQGVLIGGPGGSGKSTVSLSCVQAGFRYLSDDYVALESHGAGRYTGHSLYGSSHLDPSHLRRFPALLAHAIPGKPPLEDKSLIFVNELPGLQLDQSANIRALILPRVVNASMTCVRRASKVETLVRLAPSSLLMIPFTTFAEGFQQLSRFVNEIPTFWIDVGHDLAEIPRQVADLLATLRSPEEWSRD